jgi:hypothetical protein
MARRKDPKVWWQSCRCANSSRMCAALGREFAEGERSGVTGALLERRLRWIESEELIRRGGAFGDQVPDDDAADCGEAQDNGVKNQLAFIVVVSAAVSVVISIPIVTVAIVAVSVLILRAGAGGLLSYWRCIWIEAHVIRFARFDDSGFAISLNQ